MHFWILFRVIQRHLSSVKNTGKFAFQLMANLPSSRVQPCRHFTITDVDYADAFLIKSWSGRGVETLKCYITIFVGFSTTTISLRISDLLIVTFLAALERFLSPSGKPSKIANDCATNFRKASKELKQVYTFDSQLEKSDEVSSFILNEDII